MKRVAVLFLLFFSSPAYADLSSAFKDGNEAFVAGDFKRAIGLYQALIDSGVTHEDLYYNLANAYLRSDKLGMAILNYERALRINAAMPDAQYNLRVARDQVNARGVDRLQGAQEDSLWVRVVTSVSLADLTLIFLVSNALFFAGIAFLRFWATGFARSIAVVLTFATGISAFGSGLFLNRHLYVLESVHQAIVVADSVLMREGPHPSAAERGEVHAGLRVRIRDSNAAWSRIELSNGVEGWVPVGSVERL